MRKNENMSQKMRIYEKQSSQPLRNFIISRKKYLQLLDDTPLFMQIFCFFCIFQKYFLAHNLL
jgi:hypothetical protein